MTSFSIAWWSQRIGAETAANVRYGIVEDLTADGVDIEDALDKDDQERAYSEAYEVIAARTADEAWERSEREKEGR